MEVFALKSLEAHHISPNLTVLYHEFFDVKVISAEVLCCLPYVMFRHELICENPNIIGVTVIHRELEAEENQPLNNGRTQVDIYSKNAEVFLVDASGNRYVASVDYVLNPLMQSEEYASYCEEHCCHPMLLLHLLDRYQNYRIINEKAIELRKKVLLLKI
jgi:hypothetical protein